MTVLQKSMICRTLKPKLRQQAVIRPVMRSPGVVSPRVTVSIPFFDLVNALTACIARKQTPVLEWHSHSGLNAVYPNQPAHLISHLSFAIALEASSCRQVLLERTHPAEVAAPQQTVPDIIGDESMCPPEVHCALVVKTGVSPSIACRQHQSATCNAILPSKMMMQSYWKR